MQPNPSDDALVGPNNTQTPVFMRETPLTSSKLTADSFYFVNLIETHKNNLVC